MVYSIFIRLLETHSALLDVLYLCETQNIDFSSFTLPLTPSPTFVQDHVQEGLEGM